ncbi:porin [Aliivibrio sifiae]|nr:porin [Aliivibrio sifiae]PQJ88027.1 hypothetical protein BTO23_13870 [Aliivibrio sifiae]
MNKKLLALAIIAVSSNAVAVELYNEDGTTFDIGGHVSVALEGSDEGDTGLTAVSPRINFNATHELGNGFVADAKGEWALNYLDGGENAFTTRLGYIGVTHADFGRAVAGTQWAPYYAVAGVADMPIAFANDFIYEDHGNLGTGRAEEMLSYGKMFEMGDAGKLGVAAGWQGRKTDSDSNAEYGNRAQIALNYNVAGFSANYSYNTGDVNYATKLKSVTSESHVISGTYGIYGSGLYVAGVYAMNENMNTDAALINKLIEDSSAYEALVAYALDNSLNLSLNYESVVDNDASKTVYSTSAIQAEYNFTDKFVGFTGYQLDLGNDYNNKEDNKWMLGARYYL